MPWEREREEFKREKEEILTRIISLREEMMEWMRSMDTMISMAQNCGAIRTVTFPLSNTAEISLGIGSSSIQTLPRGMCLQIVLLSQ